MRLPYRINIRDVFRALSNDKIFRILTKMSEFRASSSPYFSVLGLTTEIYKVNFRIQSKYVIVIARYRAQYGKYFPKCSPILQETKSDNYYFIECSLKSNMARVFYLVTISSLLNAMVFKHK